jgi:hypothetical protein
VNETIDDGYLAAWLALSDAEIEALYAPSEWSAS